MVARRSCLPLVFNKVEIIWGAQMLLLGTVTADRRARCSSSEFWNVLLLCLASWVRPVFNSSWTQNCKADRDTQLLRKLHLCSRECEVCNPERAISGPGEAVFWVFTRGIGERQHIHRSEGHMRTIKYFNLQWEKRNVHYWKIGQMNENICAALIKSHLNKPFIVPCSNLT